MEMENNKKKVSKGKGKIGSERKTVYNGTQT